MTDPNHDTDPGRPDDVEVDYLDTVLYLLSNRRRRLALRCLRTLDGPVTERDLVDRVTRWERLHRETSPERLRNHVLIDMTHSHLPRLEGAGVIRRERTDRLYYEGDPTLDRWLDRIVEDDLSVDPVDDPPEDLRDP
jgi:hypothetical protein